MVWVLGWAAVSGIVFPDGFQSGWGERGRSDDRINAITQVIGGCQVPVKLIFDLIRASVAGNDERTFLQRQPLFGGKKPFRIWTNGVGCEQFNNEKIGLSDQRP